MKRNKTITIVLVLMIYGSMTILGISPTGIHGYSEDEIQYAGSTLIGGTDGDPHEVVDWINIDEAIQEHISKLRYNSNAERIAIIDSGLDRATWTHFYNEYGDWVNLMLVDYDGTYLNRYNAIDRTPGLHHGTMITSLMIQLLESYGNIEISITMFIGSDQYNRVNSNIMKQQLQRIITWNNQHTIGKYKVISMSFAGSIDYFSEEIDVLVNQQKCILVSVPGNIHKEDRQSAEKAHDAENFISYPVVISDVFGVGGIYSYGAHIDSHRIRRMSTCVPYEITGDYYVGSRYWQDGGFSQRIVDLVAPGFEIDLMCDINNDGTLEYYKDTGTSYATPQVATAAYLASRIKYKNDPSSPLVRLDFFACIQNSCENDPDGRNDPNNYKWDYVKEPVVGNWGQYTTFFSYRVGYGSLDVYDMLEYVNNLS